MEQEYIDIANWKQRYASTIDRMMHHPCISPRNRELIRSFVRDAALGKTVTGRRKKKIGSAALAGYVTHLTTYILFIKKDLDRVSQEDMETYIEALETDVIKSRARRLVGGKATTANTPYSPRYKVDNKVVVRKFYKWLWGDNQRYPEIVEWFDTYADDPEINALTEREIQRLIDKGRSSLQRSFVQVLFDGGFRLGEILNVRLKNVQLRELGQNFRSAASTEKCFVIRVPFSKTIPRTISLPMPETTKWLSMWLEDHLAQPTINSDGTLDAEDVNSQLFPMADSAARHMVNRLGLRALNKRVYPHLLRHSSATWWATRLSYFQLCKRFGWTMTSKMPKKYIDRAGIDDFAAAMQIYDDDRAKLHQEKAHLQVELANLQAQLEEISKTKRSHQYL